MTNYFFAQQDLVDFEEHAISEDPEFLEALSLEVHLAFGSGEQLCFLPEQQAFFTSFFPPTTEAE